MNKKQIFVKKSKDSFALNLNEQEKIVNHLQLRLGVNIFK